jgi:hypothetical protein
MRGIVTVAMGAQYAQMAAHVIRHSRQFTDLPIHVFTDRSGPEQSELWSTIPDVTVETLPVHWGDNRMVKTLLHKYTPFQRTLFLDCDAAIVRPGIERIFDIEATADMVLCPRHVLKVGNDIPELYLRTFRTAGVQLPVTVYYGALFAFDRDNPRARKFLERWHHYWELTDKFADMPGLITTAKELAPSMTIAHTDPEFFALDPKPDAVIWHPRPGKPAAFTQALHIPAWTPPRPALYDKWQQVPELAELPSRLHLPALPCRQTGPLCISTYVYGDYTDYVPIFALSALCAYPTAVVKIFTAGPLPAHVEKALTYLRQQLSPNIDVVISAPPNGIPGKSARWLLGREHFEGFQHLYMCDADFFICDTKLTAQHLAVCASHDLPHSNVRRWDLTDRASGIQFMNVPAYFDKVQPHLDYFRRDPRTRDLHNEVLLANLLTAADIPPPPTITKEAFDVARPHPGLHLGLLRTHTDVGNYAALWRAYASSVQRVCQSPLFRKVRNMLVQPLVTTSVDRMCELLTTGKISKSFNKRPHVHMRVPQRGRGRTVCGAPKIVTRYRK